MGFDLVDLLKKYNGDYSELEILLALRSIVRGWSGYQESRIYCYKWKSASNFRQD